MKLRNKKTGEIIESKELLTDKFMIDLFGRDFNYFNSKLNKIQEEWEGYEEDELLYVISAEHKPGYQCVLKEDYPEICKVAKELGIGFESEKECMKAVEKLKAWKLLKDECNIKFDGIIRDDKAMLKGVRLIYDRHNVTFDKMQECMGALHLLFGVEE